MSIRKVVAGLLITAGIAIMAVPFFWRATGEKQTEQLISEFEQTLEDDYDEETETEVVNPYDNSIKTQGTEKELTLFTCSQKGTMRFVVRCIYKEAVMDE